MHPMALMNCLPKRGVSFEAVTLLLERRIREICQSASEGGAAQLNAAFLPQSIVHLWGGRPHVVPAPDTGAKVPFMSAKGSAYCSPGHRPGSHIHIESEALKGRPNSNAVK